MFSSMIRAFDMGIIPVFPIPFIKPLFKINDVLSDGDNLLIIKECSISNNLTTVEYSLGLEMNEGFLLKTTEVQLLKMGYILIDNNKQRKIK